MKLTHLIIFTFLVTSGGAAIAQRPKFQPPLGQPCGFIEPLTKLEEFDSRWHTVIVRGSTRIPGTIVNGAVHVDAIELRDEGNGTRVQGVVVELRDSTRQEVTHSLEESKSYIDYEDIDAVIKAWDRLARTDDTTTKLNNFQSSYRTKGNMQIAVFRQTPGGAIAAAVSADCDRVRIFLTLDEFTKLRWMIVQAKARLDELK
jgi:hypothetical protein